jgi:hypothetical protein
LENSWWIHLCSGKKIRRRQKLVKVEHVVLCGEREKLMEGLKGTGLSGRINTAFVQRVNLAIRQGTSLLVRCTWGSAQYCVELELHIEWWPGYYHFVRYHESLRLRFSTPIERKGKRTPRRYRSWTPAMAAGLTSHRCTVLELISYPLRKMPVPENPTSFVEFTNNLFNRSILPSVL